jgi:uncharacterized protein (DUF885 family)
VWKLPRGDEYYAWALRAGTTTRMTPDEIHDSAGQEELRALQSEMDAILKKQGLTQGTVGERMTALGKQKRFRFEESDAGRAKLMAFLKARVADMRTRLPRAFATLVPGNFEIKRMPPEVEPGAPGAYGGAGHHRRQGARQVLDQHAHDELDHLQHADAHVSRIHPRPRLAGRVHLQTTAGRSLLAFNAYSEGWALYAEQLANELGVYDDDPLGAWAICNRSRSAPAGWWSTRACTRSAGRAAGHRVVRQHQRFERGGSQQRGGSLLRVAGPGLRLQGRPQRDQPAAHQGPKGLGARFDLRKFNDAVVTGGGVPMLTLARRSSSAAW